MKNLFIFSAFTALTALGAMELPTENRLMYNSHAAGYVEVKYNRSTRLDSVRSLKPARNFVSNIMAAYFTCGQWNIHSMPKKNDGTDHVPAGFNKLEKFDANKNETTVVIRNEHFLITRKCSVLQDSAIFKYEGKWESLQDNYLSSFFISMAPDKAMTECFLLKGDEKIKFTASDRFNPPYGDVMVYTDASGKNGFAVLVDQSLYAKEPMGAFFRRNGVHLPGYTTRNIKKGEIIPITVYFALFNDTDPIEAVNAARKKIFGEDVSKSFARPQPRPQVSTGRMLNASNGNAFWRMAPEMITSETALPVQKCENWQISAAGNEFVAEQLVITPEKELKNLQIKISDFVGDNGKKIAAKLFSLEYVTAIPRHAPITGCSVAGECADRLLRTIPAALGAGKHHAFLISGQIPAKTAAGIYRGTVEITADGVSQTLPLSVKVRNFALPAYSAYYADFLVSGPYADKFTKDKAAAAKFCKADLVKLRLHPASSLNVFFDKEGKVSGNPVAVLKEMFKETGEQRFRIYGSFRCTKFSKLKAMTPEMDASMTTFMKAVQSAFEKAGYLDKILWQIGDECHIEKELKSQIHYHKLTKQVVPGLKRFSTINGFNPRVKELVKESEIIAPHIDIIFRCIKDKMDISGKEIWIYNNDFMTGGIRLSKVRTVGWKSFAFGISGYHQWSVNAWVKDWRPGDDYSGCIYYPPQEGIDANPQRSMRLVNFALCVSDYDYLAILGGLIKANSGTPEAAAAQKELERILNDVTPFWHEQTTEYRKIESGREKIAELIETLQKVGKK